MQWTRTADSGKNVTNNYCATCHTLMHVNIDSLPDLDVYKAGTLTGKAAMDGGKPVQEIYVRNRPDCLEALKDAEQKDGA